MNRPIDRFTTWIAENQEYLRQQCYVLDYHFNGDTATTSEYVRGELRKAKDWVALKPEKANKRNWKRFWNNWLREALRQKDYILGHLTYRQELEYYERKKKKDGRVSGEENQDTYSG